MKDPRIAVAIQETIEATARLIEESKTDADLQRNRAALKKLQAHLPHRGFTVVGQTVRD